MAGASKDTGGKTIHATAVALEGRAVLITGPAGSGKSSLALELMAHGAALIADDGVILGPADDAVIASAPESITGRIEARGIGILAAQAAGPAPVALVVDMGKIETDRLPPRREVRLGGVRLPAVHKCEGPAFAAAILQYLKEGRLD